MRMSGKIAFCLSILYALLPLAAQTRPKVLIIPFQSGEGLNEKSTGQISEIFVSSVAAENVYELFDYRGILSRLESEGLTLKSDLAGIVEFGRSAGFDFIIEGRTAVKATDKDATHTLNPRIVAMDSGRELEISPTAFKDKDRLTGIKNLAKKAVKAIGSRSDISLGHIDALMKAGDLSNAESFLAVYRRVHPDAAGTKAAADRQALIDTTIASDKAKEATKALESYLYEEARSAIKAALARNPDNIEYQGILALIETEAARRAAENQASILQQIEGLFADKKFGAADGLINYLEQRGADAKSLSSVRTRAKRGLAAEESFKAAQASLEANDFSAARPKIDFCLLEFPDDIDYIRFKRRLVERERVEIVSREKVGLYKSELQRVSRSRLFLEKKRVFPGIALLSYSPRLSYYDTRRTERTWESVSMGPGMAFEGRYGKPFLRPLRSSLSSVDIALAWFAGGRFLWIEDRESLEAHSSLPYSRLESFSVFSGEALGGIEGRAEILSYSLDLGIDLSCGVTALNATNSLPFLGLERKRLESAMSLALGYRIGFAWIPLEGTEIKVEYRRSLPQLLGLDAIQEMEIEGFSLGICFSLPELKR